MDKMTKDDGERLAESFRNYHDQIAAMNDEARDHGIDPHTATVPVSALFDLRAENERLKVQFSEERQAFLAEQVAMQEALAEIERLRARVAELEQELDDLPAAW